MSCKSTLTNPITILGKNRASVFRRLFFFAESKQADYTLNKAGFVKPDRTSCLNCAAPIGAQSSCTRIVNEEGPYAAKNVLVDSGHGWMRPLRQT